MKTPKNGIGITLQLDGKDRLRYEIEDNTQADLRKDGALYVAGLALRQLLDYPQFLLKIGFSMVEADTVLKSDKAAQITEDAIVNLASFKETEKGKGNWGGNGDEA